jgi:hypothetical protein
MSEYKLTTRVHSRSPKTFDKLINGTGLLSMISDSLNKLSSNQYVYNDSPFSVLSEEDFDKNDNIVQSFFDKVNGIGNVFASSNPKEKLASVYSELVNIRISELRSEIRKAYNNIQNALDHNNEAVVMERIASKITKKSAGHYQIEALKAVDNLLKLSLTSFTNTKFSNVRNYILTGNSENYKIASKLLKDSFEDITPTENKRLAYTSLSTQNNEPFLLCPKGKFQGKGAVPMEISKCRDNCIDSRIEKDGRISCNYQSWLNAAFEPHDKVMARLDTTRHPDNEANLLNIEEGKRFRHEDQPGIEARLDAATEGINSARNKVDYLTSRQQQLEDPKGPYGSYRNDAQNSKKQKDFENTPLNNQLNKKLENDVVKTKTANVLDLIANKSDEYDETYESFRKNFLFKTAKLVGEEEDVKNGKENQLEDRRQNNKYTVDIEKLLDDSDIDFGHQFSDDDLKTFAGELGLDHTLEEKRDN